MIIRQTRGLKQSLNYNPSCILSVMTFSHKQLIVYAYDLSVPWTWQCLFVVVAVVLEENMSFLKKHCNANMLGGFELFSPPYQTVVTPESTSTKLASGNWLDTSTISLKSLSDLWVTAKILEKPHGIYHCNDDTCLDLPLILGNSLAYII